MSDENGGTQYDPFGNDVQQAILITNMKIYDVLMALLTTANPEIAKDLDALHTQGVVLGQAPTFLEFADREEDEDVV